MSVPGTALGALLAQHAESDLFKILLGSILAVSAYMLFRGKMKEGDSRSTRLMPVMMTIASIFAGTVSSFFGIGGGVVIVPFMILVMGMKIKEVAISSQPALLVIAFVGLAVHGLLGHPDLYQATYLLVGEFSGGLLGVRLSQRLGGRHLQIILSALIATAAIRLFWESLEEAYRGGPLFALHVLLSGTAGSAPPPCSQVAGAEQAGPFEGARRSACPDAPRDGMKACTGTGQNRQQAMQARMFLCEDLGATIADTAECGNLAQVCPVPHIPYQLCA